MLSNSDSHEYCPLSVVVQDGKSSCDWHDSCQTTARLVDYCGQDIILRPSCTPTYLTLQFLNCSDRILTFGIRSIHSPAKVGIGCYKVVNYQPGS